VSRELARYQIDIAALSETRLADEGELVEKAGGYTFYWKGKPAADRRQSGVGFAIRNCLTKQISGAPQCPSDRIMSLRFLLDKDRYATLISVYAPTMTNDPTVIDSFYEDLNVLFASVPKHDKLGDLNARVGKEHHIWKGVLGHHGIGKHNSNGLRLLSTCAAHDLVITNTLFRLKEKYKASWMHPRSRHWHLIDYVITQKCDQQDVKITRCMCGAECWTDHRLVRTQLSLIIKPRCIKKGPSPLKRLNVKLLEDNQIQSTLQEQLTHSLPSSDQVFPDVEAHWSAVKSSMWKSAETAVGFRRRRHQDWFDENDIEISNLLARKNRAYAAWLADPKSNTKLEQFKHLRQTAQSELRKIQNDWWRNKPVNLQQFAVRHNTRSFYEALREIYGPQNATSVPLKSSDGAKLFSDSRGHTGEMERAL